MTTEEAELANPRAFLADWALKRIPHHYLTRLLALAAFFQEYPVLAYYAIDSKKQIAEPDPTDHIPSELQGLPTEVAALSSFDFALGAAIVYTAQRYSLFYPHCPLPCVMPGYTGMPLSPSDPAYAAVPRFVPRLPGDPWDIKQDEIDAFASNVQRAATKTAHFTVNDALPQPRFTDFRELAPGHAWAEAIVAVVHVGSQFFLETDATRRVEKLNGDFRRYLINFLNLSLRHPDDPEAPYPKLPAFVFSETSTSEALITALHTLHTFWDAAYIPLLPGPDFFVALLERYNDQSLTIPSDFMLTPHLLGQIYDAKGLCYMENYIPEWMAPWVPSVPRGTILPMRAVELRREIERREEIWVESYKSEPETEAR